MSGGPGGTLFARWGREVALAPDGDRVAYVLNGRLCTGRVNGPSCESAADDPCRYGLLSPSWSPDSRHLVAVRDGVLWMSDADGTNCVRLSRATPVGVWASSPSWAAGAPLRP